MSTHVCMVMGSVSIVAEVKEDLLDLPRTYGFHALKGIVAILNHPWSDDESKTRVKEAVSLTLTENDLPCVSFDKPIGHLECIVDNYTELSTPSLTDNQINDMFKLYRV